MQIWRQRTEAYSNKNTPIQGIRGQISFGIQLQTFPQKWNTREHPSQTWATDGKTFFHSVFQLYSPKQWPKSEVYTTSFIYVWTFENQAEVLYASAEIQVFSGFRRPETQIRY